MVFGLNSAELMIILILFIATAAAFVVGCMYFKSPYRILLGRSATTSPNWILQCRDDFFGEWNTVLESPNKRDVQIAAQEALIAHHRFRDFINENEMDLMPSRLTKLPAQVTE